MEIVPLVPAGRQVIQSYGGGFVVAGVRHAGSVVVFPDRTVAWPAASRAEAASLPADVLAAASRTFNVLMAEERRVAAALLAIE